MPHLHRSELDYFYAVGLVKNKRLTIKSLEQYLRLKTANPFSLKIQNQQILFNGVTINALFSPQERKLLQFMLQHKGQVINRDQIAEILWQDQCDEKFSPWAIEQVIRRLRIKLAQLGTSPKLIETVPRQGYRVKY